MFKELIDAMVMSKINEAGYTDFAEIEYNYESDDCYQGCVDFSVKGYFIDEDIEKVYCIFKGFLTETGVHPTSKQIFKAD